MRSQKRPLFSFLLFFALTCPVQAGENFSDHLGATLGASYSLGPMENTRMGLSSRTMSAWSVEVLAGYRLGDWLLGVDFDYRLQSQLTGLADAGNTNLEGDSWMAGLAARSTIGPKWSVQASLGLAGKYNFKNQTATTKDSSLDYPLSIRIKPQYFPVDDLPLSVDLDLRYVSWRNFEIAGTVYNIPTTEYSVGAGVTYHFGEIQKISAPQPEPQPVPAPIVTAVEKEQVANFKVDGFSLDSSELSAEAKSKVEKAAKILSQSPDRKIKVKGYTDASGDEAFNVNLSKERADAVKKVLVENGVKPENVSTEGLGPADPVADNQTIKGKLLNRRVEIYTDESAN